MVSWDWNHTQDSLSIGTKTRLKLDRWGKWEARLRSLYQLKEMSFKSGRQMTSKNWQNEPNGLYLSCMRVSMKEKQRERERGKWRETGNETVLLLPLLLSSNSDLWFNHFFSVVLQSRLPQFSDNRLDLFMDGNSSNNSSMVRSQTPQFLNTRFPQEMYGVRMMRPQSASGATMFQDVHPSTAQVYLRHDYLIKMSCSLIGFRLSALVSHSAPQFHIAQ